MTINVLRLSGQIQGQSWRSDPGSVLEVRSRDPETRPPESGIQRLGHQSQGSRVRDPESGFRSQDPESGFRSQDPESESGSRSLGLVWSREAMAMTGVPRVVQGAMGPPPWVHRRHHRCTRTADTAVPHSVRSQKVSWGS